MAWTVEQKLAIDTRDKTLLVSAAAGSGKTATLTERIIQSILDEENPADIGRMLIATYTNAAVDELRERIGKAIKKAAVENPDNTRLEEQLLRLKDAKILTITSFCNSILRSSAESAGITPNYRIAEPPEAKILSSSVLEALINSAYEGDIPDVCTPEEFIALADCLTNVKQSGALSETISFVFDKLTYSVGGIDTLADLIEEYNPEKFFSVENTRMGKYIMTLVLEALSEYERAYQKTVYKASGEKVDERNLQKAIKELEFIREALSRKKYGDLRETLLAFVPERLSRSAKDLITDFYLSYKLIHSYLSDDIKSFSSNFFVYTPDEWRELYAKLYNLLGTLYRFLKKYYEIFMDEKRRRGICEFSDVERYAYNALYDESGNITPLAKELSEKFDSIYVDEYQDVNELQSKVFSAIAKENNRFMVGDIKQSIYGFRSARPEIFAEMKDAFPMLDGACESKQAAIFMSNNFRCDEAVIDFVNGVFDTVFGLIGSSIGYVNEDRLKFSKIYPDGSKPVGHIPEIHIIDKPKRQTADSADVADEAIEEERSASKKEAAAIAEKISELIGKEKLADGSVIEPKHVAILLRSVKGSLAESLSSALKSHGIASELTETGDLFLCEEVLLALSFLYAIDNPRKDVYLTAVMLSPLYSFSADEVLRIRRASQRETLWEALLEYDTDTALKEKIADFTASLLRYRRLSEGKPTDALLSLIYRESGLLALAARGGGKENLMLLYSYARKYEGTDFKGLYSFISYVNEIIEKGEEFSKASSDGEANAVRIMTVHKSKGLEFPVTVIAGASAGSSKNREGRIAFTENLGISIKAKDDTGLAIVENPVHNAICHYIKEKEFDEEQRVLYVALTRARERLYVYGVSPKSDTDEYIESIDMQREILSPYFIRKSKSFLDIIMLSRQGGRLIIESRDAEEEYSSLNEADSSPDMQAEAECCAIPDSEALTDELLGRFNFEYPYSHLETLPEKLSVSRLTPALLDDSEKTALELIPALPEHEVDSEEKKAPPLPKFITGRSERESAKKGIATHMVLQFCDFEKLLFEGCESELDRLESEEFISREDRERVRVHEINRFVKSPLFKEIRDAKKVYRELRFNVKLPAEKFAVDEDKKLKLAGSEILVQGVIDCLIEDSLGNLHLVDYKTDRLTKDELSDTSIGEERLISAHKLQLSYYKDAVRLMFGKAPEKVGIYSLHLGKEVDITER
ncbi:MAG: UvrD-helicase domain-containing protein [Clostridia bacterium]|nr:UvrD-helicase domain-containing protein [Clostridia bacterium]